YLRGSGAVYRDTLSGGLYLLNKPFAGVPISGGGLVLSGAVARSGVISGAVQPVTCSVTKLNMRPQDSHHWYATRPSHFQLVAAGADLTVRTPGVEGAGWAIHRGPVISGRPIHYEPLLTQLEACRS